MAVRMIREASGVPATIHPARSAENPKHLVVDDQLKKKKLSRRVVAAFPHFLIAPMIAAQTDDVLTIPKRVAEIYKSMLDIQVIVEVVLIDEREDERTHHDPANQWLRNFISTTQKGV